MARAVSSETSENSTAASIQPDPLTLALFENPLTSKGLDPFERFMRILKSCGNDEAISQLFSRVEQLLPLIQSLHHFTPSDIDPSRFSRAPSPSRLDSLSLFQVLGFDLKVTDEGRLALIEVNGMNSGMKGFAASRTLEPGVAGQTRRSDHALEHCLYQYGKEQLAFIGTELAKLGSACYRLPVVEPILESTLCDALGLRSRSHQFSIHPAWSNQYAQIVAHIARFEKFCDDKSALAETFSTMPGFKAPSYACTAEGFAQLRDNHHCDFVVVKPNSGSQGNDVSMHRIDEFNPGKVALASRMILEPFVNSYPIRSSQSGDLHDGCLRYVVLLEIDRNDNSLIDARHFGGYWRLSPLPISRYGEIDAMRANVAKGALIEPAAEHHLTMMCDTINRALPLLINAVEQSCPSTRTRVMGPSPVAA